MKELCSNCRYWSSIDKIIGKCERILYNGNKEKVENDLLNSEIVENAFIYSWWDIDKPENKAGLITKSTFGCAAHDIHLIDYLASKKNEN